VRVSPTGGQIALATPNGVWIYDFARTTFRRLTTDRAPEYSPLWTRDGQRIVFTSRRAGYPELWVRAADGSGGEARLLARPSAVVDLRANGWSADGAQLLFTEVSGTTSAIGQISIANPLELKVLIPGDSPSALSPDGLWMAYESNVSGRREVSVARYPELEQRQPISTDGGRLPVWSHDGRELFFTSADGTQILAAAVRAGTTLVAGRPQVLFEAAMRASVRGTRPYDLGRNGRFVIIRNAGTGTGTASDMIFVANWFEELKRLVPVN
jgi:Tol biopolymer transport system component